MKTRQKLFIAFCWTWVGISAVLAVLCAVYGSWTLALINACNAAVIWLNASSYRESVLAIARSQAHLDRLRGGQ